jgi:hypothetical protein
MSFRIETTGLLVSADGWTIWALGRGFGGRRTAFFALGFASHPGLFIWNGACDRRIVYEPFDLRWPIDKDDIGAQVGQALERLGWGPDVGVAGKAPRALRKSRGA